MNTSYPNVPPDLTASDFDDYSDLMAKIHQHEGIFGASYGMVNGWFWKLRAILEQRLLTKADYDEIVPDLEIRVLLALLFAINPKLRLMADKHKSQAPGQEQVTSAFDPERTMMQAGPQAQLPTFDAERTMIHPEPPAQPPAFDAERTIMFREPQGGS